MQDAGDQVLDCTLRQVETLGDLRDCSIPGTAGAAPSRSRPVSGSGRVSSVPPAPPAPGGKIRSAPCERSKARSARRPAPPCGWPGPARWRDILEQIALALQPAAPRRRYVIIEGGQDHHHALGPAQRQRRVASTPSISGMRISIKTTSAPASRRRFPGQPCHRRLHRPLAGRLHFEQRCAALRAAASGHPPAGTNRLAHPAAPAGLST